MHPILNLKNATKQFTTPDGHIITALNNVSLIVEQNEFVTLLGPSGCGKTTLLRAISGFEDLETGSITIDGALVTNLPAHKRPVNTVFQSYALFPHLNVARNVAYSLEILGMPKADITNKVGSMLELVGLEGFGDRRINQLSGGQQQRVALARSLVAQPKILLLDEPLSALDKNLRHKMQQELKTLQEEIGIAFVFVTHDQEEALTMSDRIVVLNEGEIQQLGSPEDLYRRPKSEFVARFIGEGNLLDGKVVDVFGDRARISLPSGTEIVLSQSNLIARSDVKLLVRPEDVLVGQVGIPKEVLSFNGIVDHIFFVGTDYQLIVKVDGYPTLKALVRSTGETRSHVPAAGDTVCLSISIDSLHAIPSVDHY
jgi:spermidine/putrescine transport system ATP-binding protein